MLPVQLKAVVSAAPSISLSAHVLTLPATVQHLTCEHGSMLAPVAQVIPPGAASMPSLLLVQSHTVWLALVPTRRLSAHVRSGATVQHSVAVHADGSSEHVMLAGAASIALTSVAQSKGAPALSTLTSAHVRGLGEGLGVPAAVHVREVRVELTGQVTSHAAYAVTPVAPLSSVPVAQVCSQLPTPGFVAKSAQLTPLKVHTASLSKHARRDQRGEKMEMDLRGTGKQKRSARSGGAGWPTRAARTHSTQVWA